MRILITNPRFRLVWISWLFGTLVGNAIQMTQGWLALDLTDSAFWVGTLAGFTGLIFIIFCTLGGVLADKFRRLKILLLGYASVSIVFFVMAVLISLDSMSITLLIILSIVMASLESLKLPSYLSVIADLVDKESLLKANASNFIAIGTSGILGPIIAGQLIKHFGMDYVYYFGAVVYIMISLLLVKLAFSYTPPKTPMRETVFQSIKNGFLYLKNEKLLRLLIGMMVLSETLGWTHMPMISVVARDFLGMDSQGLGNLIGAGFAGMLITTGIVSFTGMKIRPDILATIGFITFATCLSLFAVNTQIWLSFLLLSTAYGLYVMFETVTHTTIQSTVPSYMRGRVVSIQMTTWGLSAFGGFPLGIISNEIGANYAIASSNVLLVISGLILGIILINSGRLKNLPNSGNENKMET